MARALPDVIVAETTSRRSTSSSPSRASTTGPTRRRRSPRSSAAGVEEDAAAVLAEFRGAGRRFEARGEAGGVRSSTTTATTRPRSRRRSPPPAAWSAAGCARPLPAPPVLADRAPRHELGASARRRRRRLRHRVYPRARGAGPGRERQARRRPPLRAPAGDADRLGPTLDDAAHRRRVQARPGDLVLTIGAGDVDIAAGSHTRAARRMKVKENVALTRFTTLGTGGPARWFAKPETVEELVDALAWAAEQELPPPPSASARTSSSPTTGSTGSSSSWRRPRVRERPRTGEDLMAGGGAPLAVCLHRARAAGLGGLEFALRDPRDRRRRRLDERRRVRGRHRRRARRARWSRRAGAKLADARRARAQLPALRPAPGQVVAGAELQLEPRPEEEIRAIVARCRPSGKQRSRRTSGRSGACSRTPDTSSPRGGCSRPAGCAGHRDRRRADLSQARELHRERRRGANRRRARPDRRGPAPRAREFGVRLEPEVQLLGPIEIPPISAR